MPSDVNSTTSYKGGEVSGGASATVQSDRARDRRLREERSRLYYDVEVPLGSYGLEGGLMARGGAEGFDAGFDIEQMSRISYDPTERHRSGQSYLNLSRPSPVASAASDEPSAASEVTIESYTRRVERSKSSRCETVPKVKVTFSPRPQMDPEFRPRRQSSFRLPRSPPVREVELPRCQSSIRLSRSPPPGEFELP